MAVLDNVKLSLGITSNSRDSEITAVIETAKRDLMIKGVKFIQESDPMTERAIVQYCRAWFNFQGDADRYTQSYEKMANAMALDIDYGADCEGWPI